MLRRLLRFDARTPRVRVVVVVLLRRTLGETLVETPGACVAMSYRRSTTPTRRVRAQPVFDADEARVILLALNASVDAKTTRRADDDGDDDAGKWVKIETFDAEKRYAVFVFETCEEATVGLDALRTRTRGATLANADAPRADARWTVGYSSRNGDDDDEQSGVVTRTMAHRQAEELGIEGLTLIEDYVTPDEERRLAELATTSGNRTRLAKRKVTHFGYSFDYGTRDANTPAEPIPELVGEVLRRLPASTVGYESAARCDQVTVNEYPRGVGLAPHVDTHSAFGESILSLSLLGGAVMEFRTSDEEHRALYLPPRSMLVMHGEARYRWQHYIPHRKFDDVQGESVARGEIRLSYTFRERRFGACECRWPTQCDSRAGAESKCSKRRNGETQQFTELIGE